jgi:hypothetical protein
MLNHAKNASNHPDIGPLEAFLAPNFNKITYLRVKCATCCSSAV